MRSLYPKMGCTLSTAKSHSEFYAALQLGTRTNPLVTR
uniref:Uncharacterized protein n=1 Tax=Anguilla anguilla TaxID=7936 RepID=A0A0E9UTC3_ANGAN